MKKKLNESDIMNELRDGSLFFQKPAAEEDERDERDERAVEATVEQVQAAPEEASAPAPKTRKRTTRNSKNKATNAPAEVVQNAGDDELVVFEQTAVSPLTEQAERIETIRKAVKQLGKEATFSRLTEDEKRSLGEVVYTYKRSGIRTSENEVVRIAVNWLLEDYFCDGQNSVLARVLAKLNA